MASSAFIRIWGDFSAHAAEKSPRIERGGGPRSGRGDAERPGRRGAAGDAGRGGRCTKSPSPARRNLLIYTRDRVAIRGSPISGPDEQNVAQPLTGLGAGSGVLVVPAGDVLTAYGD
jgi:hypothetical protein